jgi:hypothetical protein
MMEDDKNNVINLFGEPDQGPKDVVEAVSKVAEDLSDVLVIGRQSDGRYFIARSGQDLEFFAMAKLITDRMASFMADLTFEEQDVDPAE